MIDAIAFFGSAEPVAVRVEVEKFPDFKIWNDGREIWHVAELLQRAHRILEQVVAQNRHFPVSRLEQVREDANRGRLAGTVRTDEAEDLALLELEADIVDRSQVAVVDSEIVDLKCRCVIQGRLESGVLTILRRHNGL